MSLLYFERKIENYVIEKLKEAGWNYIEERDLKRTYLDEPLLIENLKRKIITINKDVELTDEDIKNILNKVQATSYNQNGHKELLRYFKYGVPIKTEKERLVKHIQLFDYKNPENNEFIFTNQFNFSGRENIRLDLVLFINGIPLVNIELKNPYTLKTDYYSAYRQIKRYERIAPELYKYIQIGIGYAEKVKYFPIVPWIDEVEQFIWRWEDLDEENSIFFMLKPENLLDIIKNFLFIREFRGEMKKVIARYMQFRAVNKIYKRVMDNLQGKSEKNKGLIWHWQGSGKTLTMIFSAHKLYFELEKPTIFFIIDRRDLERQFGDELASLDLNFSFEKIESISKLKEIITFDNYKGKRGVFLTLIHKFNIDEEFLLEELTEKGQIQERKNIICFLDEVHRTQYGKLAGKMRNILKNAFFFGFTGTPIFYKDRNTYEKFGYIDQKEWYLDKYFIDESERDGFTLPIVYELRKEEVRLKDIDLEWYLEQVDVEDIGDELELSQIEEAVRKRLNEITLILENPKNIEKACEDIAEHFKTNFDGFLKGLIVTASRKACIRFKRILDKYLPSKYSEVVITFNPSDPGEPEEISEYRKELITKFGIKNTDEIIKEVIKRFKNEEYPKLLIVTDMLITGFDEPRLGVLYLYKLLKNHRLLQTIARVNRPYLNKASGLVVDYAGIFKYLKKAIGAYLENGEKKIFEKAISDKNSAFERFEELLKRLKELFKELPLKFDKEIFDKALNIVKGEKGTEFVTYYIELRKWYEFLKSEEKMVNYLSEYRWFSTLYEYYKKLMRPDIDENKVEKLFKKTVELVHELTEVKGLKKLIRPSIIDINYIKKLKSSDLTEEEKIIGTLSALHHIIYTIGSKNPIYKTIADRVRELFEKWQKDEMEIKEIALALDEILEYIEKKEEERKETGLNEKEFGIKVILENKIKEEREFLENIAKEIYSKISPHLYPDWNKNPAKVSDVSRIVREYLIDLRGKYRLSYEDFDRLHKEIFDYIYGT